MTEKYDVKMLKKIFSCEEHDGADHLYLYYNFQLPFPPFVGLWIHQAGIAEMIESVSWDMGSEMFRVFAEDDEEIKRAHLDGKPHRDTETIVDEYLEMGWQEETEGEGELEDE